MIQRNPDPPKKKIDEVLCGVCEDTRHVLCYLCNGLGGEQLRCQWCKGKGLKPCPDCCAVGEPEDRRERYGE